MKGTQVLIGVAMAAIIGVTASFPGRVDAAPQLTTLGGVAAAPKLDPGSTTNYGKIKDSAQAVKKAGDARAAETNKYMDEGDRPHLDSLASKVYSAGEIVAAYRKDPRSATKTLSGAPVSVNGVVVNVMRGGANGATTVFLAPPGGAKGAPLFAFRFGGEVTFESGSQVELQGTFIDRIQMESVDSEVFLVQAAGESGAAPAVGTPSSGPVPEVKPFDGWRFVGSVATGPSATGVFVKDGETLYAQPGDSLSPGLKVVDVKAGEAVLSEGGRRSSIMPW